MSPRHKRRARAEARIRCSGEVRGVLREEPVWEEARVSATLAARRAGEWLVEATDVEDLQVDLEATWGGEGLELSAFVEGYARAPIGSRALTAVQVAAGVVVDRAPGPVEQVAVEEARITMQKGGLEGLSYDFDPTVEAGVLVVSDAVAGGHKEDRAGEAVRQAVAGLGQYGVALAAEAVIGDDAELVAERVDDWYYENVELILTVGGTGLTHTDRTVEAVEPMLDRTIPGLMEAIRDYGQQQTPVAFMSRGVAGLIGDTLVVTLPGSSAGAREAVEAIFPAILHVIRTRRKSREHLTDDNG